jgi:hypothetical protein
MGGTRNTYRGEERCRQDVGEKTGGKETTGKTQA